MENIVKKIDIKRVSVLSILIVLSVFAFVTSWTTIGMVLLISSVVLACLGLKKEVYSKTGSPVKHYSFYFEGERRREVSEAINDRFKEGYPVVCFTSSGSGKLDVRISKDRRYAVIVVSHFVPHRYEPVGEPVVLENENLTELCSYLEKCSGKKLF